MKYEYIPHGVCSRKMVIDIENGVINSLEVVGGCNGNLKGIASLVKGMSVGEVIKRLSGIRCNGKPTSCPAQLAQGLETYLRENGQAEEIK